MPRIKDPILGLCQRMANGAKYMVLSSAFYNLHENLVCNVLVTTTGKEIEYAFDRILDDCKSAKEGRTHEHRRGFKHQF